MKKRRKRRKGGRRCTVRHIVKCRGGKKRRTRRKGGRKTKRKGRKGGRRKVNAYARFVGKLMKRGVSMKEAARRWRKSK